MILLCNEGTTNNGLWRDKISIKGQCEALKKPICQHYHWFLSMDCRPEESCQKPKDFKCIPSPQGRRALTFSIAEKVSKKSRLKKGDCAHVHL
jgi:hypothetical protein